MLAALPACLWRFQKNSSISLAGDGFNSSGEYFPPPTSFYRESEEMASAMYRFQAWQFSDCNSRSSGAGRPYSVARRNHALSSARIFTVFGASSSMRTLAFLPHRTMLLSRPFGVENAVDRPLAHIQRPSTTPEFPLSTPSRPPAKVSSVRFYPLDAAGRRARAPLARKAGDPGLLTVSRAPAPEAQPCVPRSSGIDRLRKECLT